MVSVLSLSYAAAAVTAATDVVDATAAAAAAEACGLEVRGRLLWSSLCLLLFSLQRLKVKRRRFGLITV